MSEHHDIHFTIPSIWILLPLAIGICFHGIPWQAALAMGVIAAAMTACYFVFFRNSITARWLMPLALCLGMAAAGHTLYNAQAQSIRWRGDDGICRVTITSRAAQRANSWEYDAETYGQRVKIYMPTDSTLTPGTVLWVRTRWNNTHESQKTETFDYLHYLFLQGYSATSFINGDNYDISSETCSPGIIQRLRASSAECREKVIAIYRRSGISGDALAVVSALTLGSREELSPELKQSYVRAGAMHVLAVSGLHVGIICLILMRLLWIFGFSRIGRILRLVSMIAALTGYAFITGLTPSVVRAALMFCFIMVASLLQKKQNLLNTLFFTAFITLLIDPIALYSVSFQLSYCATGTIVAALPWLRSHEPEQRLWRMLYYALGVALTAQLGATPLLLYHFHQFSTVFFASALLVVPFAELVIYGAAGLLLTQFSPTLSGIVAVALQWLLDLQNRIVGIIQSPSWSSLELWISLPQCIALATISICLIWLLYARDKWRAGVVVMIAVAVFMAVSLASVTSRKGERVVIGSRGETVVHIGNDGKMTVCCSDSARAYNEAHELGVKYRTTTTEWRVCRNSAFMVKGSTWVVAQDTMLRNMSSVIPLHINNLVAGRAVGRMRPEKLMGIYEPDTIHLLPPYPKYRRQALDSIAATHGIVIKE